MLGLALNFQTFQLEYGKDRHENAGCVAMFFKVRDNTRLLIIEMPVNSSIDQNKYK
jgi:hypothetical protein